MENIKQSKSKKEQLTLDPNKTMMGSSGGLAIVGSAGLKAVKGAFNLVKNILSRSSKVKTATTGSIKNPVGMNVKTYLESHGKLISSSKGLTPKPGGLPVNFKGPNPVSKIGAGGNSY